MNSQAVYAYQVWDVPTRLFHWTNAISVAVLIALGLAIYFSGALSIGNDGKVLLKTAHVWVGYLFLANLAWRLVWAFAGNRYARWRALLPWGHGYPSAVAGYLRALASGRPRPFVGHNPLGRLAVTLLLVLLLVQAASGLVLAGTDIFYPPFGHWIASWIAAPGVAPGDLVPYRPELVDAAAQAEMRALRAPVIATHEWGFYLLATLIVLHVVAVVITEVREGGTLITAMVTGRKVFTEPAEDDVDPRSPRREP
ncbi:MAG: cytochrome b/b6 domain-containing protein [Pseudomonadales bacterium]